MTKKWLIVRHVGLGVFIGVAALIIGQSLYDRFLKSEDEQLSSVFDQLRQHNELEKEWIDDEKSYRLEVSREKLRQVQEKIEIEKMKKVVGNANAWCAHNKRELPDTVSMTVIPLALGDRYKERHLTDVWSDGDGTVSLVRAPLDNPELATGVYQYRFFEGEYYWAWDRFNLKGGPRRSNNVGAGEMAAIAEAPTNATFTYRIAFWLPSSTKPQWFSKPLVLRTGQCAVLYPVFRN